MVIVNVVLLLFCIAPAQISEPLSPPDVLGRPLPQIPASPAVEDKPLEGIWPSTKLRDLLLTRWADQAAVEFGLDDDQRADVTKRTVERWGSFLSENRSTIQPLVNEFIEMRMELAPPTKERVKKWADRSGPMLEKFAEELEVGVQEFREVLNPEQRLKFEAETLGLKVGLAFARQKITQWQTGDFDPEDLWEPTRMSRRERREMRRERREARDKREADFKAEMEKDQALLDQIAIELTSWERFVANFIGEYSLDEGQRGSVLSILTELKQQASAHRDRNSEDINRLEAKIAKFSGSDDELAKVQEDLTRLYGPVDEMFVDLKNRIELIPTAQQRAAAAAKEIKAKEKISASAPPSTSKE